MTLEDWILRQRRHAAAMMRQSISPGIVKTRPRFFQTIVPKPGSVVASPVLAAYDPEPDYFFHWYRDSALVMDALRLVQDEIEDAPRLFDDFVRFSWNLGALDGRDLPPPQAEPDFVQFLRADLRDAHGAAIAAETRVNPDGSLDITDWPRPQHDGPALRALSLLRWGVESDHAAHLLRADLAFVLKHARQPSFGVWEEERGLHYYVLRVSAAALVGGAAWLAARGGDDFAGRCRSEARAIIRNLENWWDRDFIRAHILEPRRAEKELDVSVILAANHAGAAPDERLMATLAKLETQFGNLYQINRGRAAPVLGRYGGDTYYGGGAWYAATLAAAEFCYRAGERARGDGFLETVRAFTPDSGDMSEQFDRLTGAQTSARHLAWSYAAFITAIAARRAASAERPAATAPEYPAPERS
jgi:glucoamylase